MAGSKPAALPLGDTPASVRPRGELAGAHLTAASGLPPVLEAFVHGRGVQALSHEAHPAIGHPRPHALDAPDRGPVKRPGENRASHSSASATCGARARTTGSQSLRPPDSKKARIVMRGEFRVNAGRWNPSRVLMATPG